MENIAAVRCINNSVLALEKGQGKRTRRMFEILDYKWKVDPETGQEWWLEVIRAVVDGSTFHL